AVRAAATLVVSPRSPHQLADWRQRHAAGFGAAAVVRRAFLGHAAPDRRQRVRGQHARTGAQRGGQRSMAVLDLDLVPALTRAVDDGTLQLHFQPEIDLASGSVVGMEALLRW